MGDVPIAPGPSRDVLYRSLVENGQLLILTFHPDGMITYASGVITRMLGRDPQAVLGTNVLEWLHPEDVDRAIYQIASSASAGVAQGITRFRVAHADGSWVPLEIFADAVTDGENELIGIYARDGSNQVYLEEVMRLLLTGSPRRDALLPVCNTVQWAGSSSHVAIDWIDAEGHHQVNTGIDPALGGAGLGGAGRGGASSGRDPGAAGGAGATVDGDLRWQLREEARKDTWARVRKTGVASEGIAGELGPRRARMATEAELASFWIEPVIWSEDFPPATVTVWTGEGRSPWLHSYGMEVAKSIVELILRWTEQVQELDRAAQFDSLTKLANRRAFFGALSRETGGGAVLYCDLDRFKPVNDELGHAAGDELLTAVARRLESSVRETDLVARLGGDEFAVLCYGATAEEADEVAGRIRVAVEQPFEVGGVSVTVGISVGAASDPVHLTQELLEQADRALAVNKADRAR